MHVVHDFDIIHEQLKSCLHIVEVRELWLLKKPTNSSSRAVFVIHRYNLQENSEQPVCQLISDYLWSIHLLHCFENRKLLTESFN